MSGNEKKKPIVTKYDEWQDYLLPEISDCGLLLNNVLSKECNRAQF